MTHFVRIAALITGLSLALATHATTYDLPEEGINVVGKIKHIKTEEKDTFVALSREFDIGYRALKEANPDVDPWLPGDGTRITLPTRYVLPDAPHQGIVINLTEMRLYYYPPEDSDAAGQVITLPLGIGRQGWQTPLGKTQVSQKIPQPSWTVPQSIREEHAEDDDPLPKVVPAGPDNPLGQYALQLSLPGYLIHGTNKPRGIGMQVSHGCIRLYPKDIKHLYKRVTADTPVHIVNQPYKVGWDGDRFLMSAHPTLAHEESNKQSYPSWTKTIVTASNAHREAKIDWDRASAITDQANGIPQAITGVNQQPDTERQSVPKSTPGSTTDSDKPATPEQPTTIPAPALIPISPATSATEASVDAASNETTDREPLTPRDSGATRPSYLSN